MNGVNTTGVGPSQNGRHTTPIQIISLVMQFLVIPALWLIWSMTMDISGMKVQMARLEGRLESHQSQTEREMITTMERKRLEQEIAELKDMIAAHRNKSTYDRPAK